MEVTRLGVSSCQRCRHFTFEGRRGGHCGQLNVPVQGRWSACSLADPVFAAAINDVAQTEVTAWSEVILLHRRETLIPEDGLLVEPA